MPIELRRISQRDTRNPESKRLGPWNPSSIEKISHQQLSLTNQVEKCLSDQHHSIRLPHIESTSKRDWQRQKRALSEAFSGVVTPTTRSIS
jgi:hypothetical protein